jgi:hypothetical protein
LERVIQMRTLIAFEEQYRVYREVIGSAIQSHRPHVVVAVAGLDTLKDEVTRFDPHLVICSQPNTVESNGRPAWFELPPDPDRFAKLCFDGEHSETANPALEELLRVVDDTERLIRTKPDSGNC